MALFRARIRAKLLQALACLAQGTPHRFSSLMTLPTLTFWLEVKGSDHHGVPVG